MNCHSFRLQLFCPALQPAQKSLFFVLCLQAMTIAFPANAAATSQPCILHDKPAILYTGETYGYLRANDDRWTGAHMPDSAATAFDTEADHILNDCPQAILVGTGDNLAPEYKSRIAIMPDPVPADKDQQWCNHTGAAVQSTLQGIMRLNPCTVPDSDYWRLEGPPKWIEQSPAVRFFLGERCTESADRKLICKPDPRKRYDALVPGQLDFYFGADFLAHAGAQGELPLLGANLTIQGTKQLPQEQPTCSQAQLLLPTQVSLPIAGSGSAGGKGKGGKAEEAAEVAEVEVLLAEEAEVPAKARRALPPVNLDLPSRAKPVCSLKLPILRTPTS
jgi:hypothetical protein